MFMIKLNDEQYLCDIKYSGAILECVNINYNRMLHWKIFCLSKYLEQSRYITM